MKLLPTGLETVDRYRLSRSINPTDTLHLEVAVVGGKELFARKGATQFQGDDPAAFTLPYAPAIAVGTVFALLAK